MFVEDELAQMVEEAYKKIYDKFAIEASTWVHTSISREEVLDLMKKAYLLGHEHGFEEITSK